MEGVAAAPPLRALLPREHGSWALVLEPIVLALCASFSLKGVAVAVCALALFLARRPCWVAVRVKDRARVRQARAVALALAGVAVAAGGPLLTGAGIASLPPLIVAVMAAGAFALMDARGASRGLFAECTGALAFCALGSIVVLENPGTGARAPLLAAAVGGFALVRALTALLPVRAYIRRRKREIVSALPALLVACAGVVAMCVLAPVAKTWVPALWASVFALRTAWLLGPFAPSLPARRLGMLEAVLGGIAVITTGISLS